MMDIPGLKTLKKIFEKMVSKAPELDIMENLKKNLDLSLKAIDIIYSLIIDCKDYGEAALKANEVLLMEREADNLTEETFTKILRGSIPPALVSELQYLVDKTDDIMDRIYFIGMELARAYKNRLVSNEELKSIYADIGLMLSLAKSGLQKLQELYITAFRNRENTMKLRAEIDVIEDRIDEAKNQALNKIYESKGLRAIEIFHAIELIRVVDDIADATEDAAHAVVRLENSIIS
ncbi:MAG: DUF47 family protein [Desulfurococcales archaeon]|jgi:uncharacterized protein Yka (UPF0111/DUF47 family)|nr:DUF47 family protein [Desulfurococcales archaeon]